MLRILLATYDNDSFVSWFPQGLAAVAAVIKQDGHSVSIWDSDINHYPSNELTTFLDNNDAFDVIGISLIAGYWQYKKLMELSSAIARSKKRPPFFIIGGYGPTPEPEYFLKKTQADIVVMGEGEDTTRELLKTISAGKFPSGIRGIAYRQEDTVTINPQRELIPEDGLGDESRVPMPAYELFDVNAYRLYRVANSHKTDFTMPVLSGRGCTFKCNFCYRMDTGFRPRPVPSILEEIDYLQIEHKINYILFSDDLLMVSKERSIEIAEGFIQHQEKTKRPFKWNCNGRLNYCTPEILALMKRAGCGYINFGIEAYDNDALKKMKKGLNTDIIDRGIAQTIKAGIHPGLNFIWGNIGETIETLDKATNFLLDYDNHAELRTIRPVTPYPGSPLYYHAINNGLLDSTNPAEDFYERKHLNSDLIACNFTNLSDDAAHAALAVANKRLIDSYIDAQKRNLHRQTDKLYIEKDIDFRGYRQGGDVSGLEKAVAADSKHSTRKTTANLSLS